MNAAPAALLRKGSGDFFGTGLANIFIANNPGADKGLTVRLRLAKVFIAVVLPPSTVLFGEGGETGFVDLQDDAGVAVGYFADTVLGGGAEDLGYFGGGEFVIVGKPVGHVVGGVLEGVVEIAAVAGGHDVSGGFDADGGDALVGDDVDGELDVH